MTLNTHQPDLKPNESLYNPDMNPNFYHLGRGFNAGTRATGDAGGLENTIVSGFPDGPDSPDGLVNWRHPGSGYPAYLLEREALVPTAIESNRKPDGLVVSGEPVVVATPTNEALVAPVSNEFYWLAYVSVIVFLRRLWCWSASQPPTLEPLALANSISLRRNCYAPLIS